MLSTMWLPMIGCVKMHVRNILFSSGMYQFVGKNDSGDTVYFTADRASFPDDLTSDYGWIHIISYMFNGKSYKYEKYVSLG